MGSYSVARLFGCVVIAVAMAVAWFPPTRGVPTHRTGNIAACSSWSASSTTAFGWGLQASNDGWPKTAYQVRPRPQPSVRRPQTSRRATVGGWIVDPGHRSGSRLKDAFDRGRRREATQPRPYTLAPPV
jgi:hypothetical protein